jgi:UDP-3-O-[3-hydroxymyristoyl] glucosamine N-acyltransferase
VIPCEVRIGKTTFTTSLFPKDGGYLVPIKNVVRIPEKLELGQNVAITLTLSA